MVAGLLTLGPMLQEWRLGSLGLRGCDLGRGFGLGIRAYRAEVEAGLLTLEPNKRLPTGQKHLPMGMRPNKRSPTWQKHLPGEMRRPPGSSGRVPGSSPWDLGGGGFGSSGGVPKGALQGTFPGTQNGVHRSLKSWISIQR